MKVGEIVHYVPSTENGVPTCHPAIVTRAESTDETGLDYERCHITVFRPNSSPASLHGPRHEADELGAFHRPGEGWCAE